MNHNLPFFLQGPNLLKLARKEQCLALLTQLRSKFKLNGQFYRVFPNGEVRCDCLPSASACAPRPELAPPGTKGHKLVPAIPWCLPSNRRLSTNTMH